MQKIKACKKIHFTIFRKLVSIYYNRKPKLRQGTPPVILKKTLNDKCAFMRKMFA
jgi:hypothetical protein